MDYNDHMIEEVLKHLDSELAHGAARMSVIFDDTAEEEKRCHISAVTVMADLPQRQWGCLTCTRILVQGIRID